MTKSLKIILPILVLFSISSGFAQDIPKRSEPPKLVNDFAKLLSNIEQEILEKKLVRFNDTTSNQITVVTIESLKGYDVDLYAYEIGEKWKVGQAAFDNGVVLLIKPKYSNSRGQVSIQVGYGLEPAIPDAIAKRIIEKEILPEFRKGDYFEGINRATDVLMQLAAGEITADGYAKGKDTPAIISFLPFIIIIIAILLIRSTSRRSYGMGKSSLPFWTALWLGSSIGRSGSGGWSGFSGGSGGFGGGGGFGGFGGGSFGGGGASGSW